MGEFWENLSELGEAAVEGVQARWALLPVEIADGSEWETIGGLLARQATLVNEMAMSPTIWNPHIAPIILRSMIDCYITLLWVLADPAENSRKYVLYGLGQQKLFLEHLRVEAETETELIQMIEIEEAWLNQQRGEFATTVDVGNLGEKTTRAMAIEAGCEAVYKFPYQRFSGVAHNMWQHVGRFNLQICDNPLHKYHRVPMIPVFDPDLDWMYQAAKHLSRSFKAVDDKYGLDVEVPLPLEVFLGLFGESGDQPEAPDAEPGEDSSEVP